MRTGMGGMRGGTYMASPKNGPFVLPRRATEGRLFGGVCAGLAHRYSADVTLMRLGFLLLALAWGVGLVVYAALWLVLPDDETRDVGSLRDSVKRNARHWRVEASRSHRYLQAAWARSGGDSNWPRPLTRRWVAVGLVAGGGAVLLASFGAFAWLTPVRAIGLAAMALGVGTLLSLR